MMVKNLSRWIGVPAAILSAAMLACPGNQKREATEERSSQEEKAAKDGTKSGPEKAGVSEQKDAGDPGTGKGVDKGAGKDTAAKSDSTAKQAGDKPAADKSSGNDPDKKDRKGGASTVGDGRDASKEDSTKTDPSSKGKSDASKADGGGKKDGAAKTDGRASDAGDASVDVRGRDKKKNEILPEEKSDGYVSESTYQVFITVFARSEAEAVKAGRTEAARKTMNMILTSDDGPRRMSEDGRRELKRFIESNGEVAKIVQESAESWSVVFRLKKDGLREYIKRIK